MQATAARLRLDWEVDVEPGGSHVGRGTRNELTGLGGATYLEIVGPDPSQPEPEFPRPFGVDGLTDATLVAWCARPTRPLPEVVAAVAALGIDLGSVAEMSRARPDGVLLEWQLTFPMLGPDRGGVLPFLIDWQQSPHPSDSVPHHATLHELRLTHPDPDLVRAVLREIGDDTDIRVTAGSPGLTARILTASGEVSL
ncbi:MAG: VOC family protein [Actinomycetota bacterium]|nr:VOC family protein [Actinomycetota bacterium]